MPLYQTPSPRVYTTAEQATIAAQTAQNIATNIPAAANQALQDHLSRFLNAINAVWNNKDMAGNPVDPSAVLLAMGTNASTAFQVSSNAATYILQQAALVHDASTLATITSQVNSALALVKPTTVNADGSVTVN